MAGEAGLTPRTEVEKGMDEGEGLTVKGSKMEGVSCKKTQSARLRRLELRRLNSHSGGSPVKRIRNPDENSESFSDASSSSSSPTRSLPSYPNADEATAAETAAVGILASGGEMHGGNVEAVKFPCLSHGSVSLIGRRREMEDAVTVAPGFAADGEAGAEGSAPEYVFFAVYDGHGGAQVALACRDRLHVVLAEEVAGAGAWPRPGGEEEEGQWKRALAACFARVDGEVSEVAVRAGADAAEKTVGSTAVVAVVGTRRIVVANCGDSRAVLSRGGVALPLSSDHKPDRPDELERVEAAGGRVISWNGSRVLGVLATSRSIGDYYLKPYVIAEPEITAIDRMERDEFLILASDGLWDVVSNEVACRITRQCLTGRAARMYPEAVSGRTAAEAAALLAELAISRGSRDNISVVVVELKRLGSKRSDALGFQGHPFLPKSL